MTKFAIEIDRISKTFGKDVKALDELSFSIPKGVICGVVGANGAGKTTLYSAIAGYIPYDSGTISKRFHFQNVANLSFSASI